MLRRCVPIQDVGGSSMSTGASVGTKIVLVMCASAVRLSSLTNLCLSFLSCKIEVPINWRYSVVIKDTLDQERPVLELVLPLGTSKQFINLVELHL